MGALHAQRAQQSQRVCRLLVDAEWPRVGVAASKSSAVIPDELVTVHEDCLTSEWEKRVRDVTPMNEQHWIAPTLKLVFHALGFSHLLLLLGVQHPVDRSAEPGGSCDIGSVAPEPLAAASRNRHGIASCSDPAGISDARPRKESRKGLFSDPQRDFPSGEEDSHGDPDYLGKAPVGSLE